MLAIDCEGVVGAGPRKVLQRDGAELIRNRNFGEKILKFSLRPS